MRGIQSSSAIRVWVSVSVSVSQHQFDFWHGHRFVHIHMHGGPPDYCSTRDNQAPFMYMYDCVYVHIGLHVRTFYTHAYMAIARYGVVHLCILLCIGYILGWVGVTGSVHNTGQPGMMSICTCVHIYTHACMHACMYLYRYIYRGTRMTHERIASPPFCLFNK